MATVQAGKRIDFKNILFLTDFSEPSIDALPFAAGIARTYGSMVHAVHVLTPSIYTQMAPENAPALLDDQEELAQAEMQRVEAQLADLPRKIAIERGSNLWEVVSRLQREGDFDLLVLGTHGRTGLKKALLGSSAEEVFRRSRVPVLMSGPATRLGAHDRGHFSCVLFATDFDAVSSAAAPYAISLAEENQANLVLLHVLPAPRPGKPGTPGKSRDLSVAEAIHKLEAFVPREAELWCRPRTVVEHGAPVAQILTAAKLHEADLIVLGVHGLDAMADIRARARSDIAYDLIAHARCPVLTVRGDN